MQFTLIADTRPKFMKIAPNIHPSDELIGTNPSAIKPALDELFAGEWKKGSIPELCGGKAAKKNY